MGKKFPFHLLLAFGGQSSLSPNLQINVISPLAVGAPDELLGYTSLSSGAVTYSSSDVTKATIVQVGGSYYLHAVAAGTVTITASQAASGSYASATSPGSATIAQFPTLPGLTAHFDFTNASSVTTAGSKLVTITEPVQGIVMTQNNPTYQPTYNTGGKNGLNYANFNGAYMTGALVQGTVSYTAYMVRANQSTQINYIWQIGSSGSNGYYMAECETVTGAWKVAASVREAVGTQTALGSTATIGLVEAMCSSYGVTDGNQYYNISGYSFVLGGQPSGVPIAPTGQTQFGGIGGVLSNPDFYELIIYNQQHTQAQTIQMMDWLKYKYALSYANNFNSFGDSIATATIPGTTSSWPQLALQSIVSNKYCYNRNNSVPGYTTDDVVAGMTANVINQFIPKIKNVFVMTAGHNDIAADKTADYIWNNILNNITTPALNAGYTVIIGTVLNSTGFTGQRAVVQADVNNRIRTLLPAGATYVDFQAIPQMADPNNTTYFGDGVHPTDAGLLLMANLVYPMIQSYF